MTELPPSPPARSWNFLTSHAHVLIAINSDPTMRTRDIADAVGITERATQRIIADLEAAGHLTRVREGRRNRYVIHGGTRLRHPLNQEHELNELLGALGD
ncbi:MAG: MarR family transcriptional regulator [Thermoleophilia bacterium]|nr:MarR family transcriptional regulator [Thermoleophilia bacterium]